MADKIPHNVGRIDHIVFVVHPETADGAAERFEQVLGISFTDRYEVPAIGIRLYIDWSAGIEIVTPVDRSLAVEYAEHLDKHGEGIFRLVFGVAGTATCWPSPSPSGSMHRWFPAVVTESPLSVSKRPSSW